jgi:deferrochelatase/peroxidase EfeB
VALDLLASTKAALRSVLVSLSRTAGAVMAPDAEAAVTVTVGLGRSLFVHDGRDRLGLATTLPAQFADLPAFPGDKLDPARCGGDLGLQVCGADMVTALAVARELLNSVDGQVRIRWWQSGFTTADAHAVTPRNVMGFKDGTANPPPGQQRNDLVWVNDGSWMTNGTYLVVRRITTDLARWDAVGVHRQEQVIGRSKRSGAPLSGAQETDKPDFAAHRPDRAIAIPLNAHIRRANLSFTKGAQILRRGYNFNDPRSTNPGAAAGLVFLAYQADPQRGFIPIQQRLASTDALNDFITPTGSALFAIPPGANRGGFVGHTLLGD